MKAMYPACFYVDDDGVTVIFPDLDGLATDGETVDEAMYYAIECLAGYLYLEEKEGNDIPEPSDIASVDPVKIARELDPEDLQFDTETNNIFFGIHIISPSSTLSSLVTLSRDENIGSLFRLDIQRKSFQVHQR